MPARKSPPTSAIQSARLRPKPTLAELMATYLSQLSGRAPEDIREARFALDLLCNALGSYGSEFLSPADSRRWLERVNANAPMPEVCQLVGPGPMLKFLDEFLTWFLIRKMAISEDDLSRTIEEVGGFIDWLHQTRAISDTAARKARGTIARASVDTTGAERLSHLLYEVAQKREAAYQRGRPSVFDEIVEDYLVIERVAPGRIWFLDEVGPIKVPEAASAIARPGWTVNLVLGRRGDTWETLEVGNVYPQTLA